MDVDSEEGEGWTEWAGTDATAKLQCVKQAAFRKRRWVLSQLKRSIDCVGAAAALLTTLPIFVLVSILIRLDSPGPALFKQTRIGKGRRPFRLIKFRTMVHRDPKTVDQTKEAVISSDKDSRITRVGRLLRGICLDELPQLWCVLRGDMSLVGPRPLLPEQLRAVPDEAADRFAVSPGMSGLAQVSGRRRLTWPEQLALDVEYARQASLLVDIRILLRTVKLVFRGEGAYGDPSGNWRAYLGELSTEESDTKDR